MPPSTPGSPPQSTSRNSHWRARCIERCTAGSGRGPLEKDLPSRHLASGLPELLHSGSAVPRGVVTVTVAVGDEVIRVEVTDRCGGSVPVLPAAAPADDEAEGSRGLWLVDALSARWGYERDGGLATTWFELGQG
jgi:hypothetical protein